MMSQLLRFFPLICVTFALASAEEETVKCYASNSSSIETQCTVYYNQTVVLICPFEGVWFKGSINKCNRMHNCTLPEDGKEQLTFVNDNGSYSCEEGGRKSIVHLTIIGPPEFVSSENSTYVPKDGFYSLVTLQGSNYWTYITVMVVGHGPFNILWTFNDSTDDACSMDRVTCQSRKINGSAMIFTYRIKTGFPRDNWSKVGTYTATVTNTIGRRHAKTFAEFSCNLPSNKPKTVNPAKGFEKKTVIEGESLLLQCVAIYSSINSYGICYSYPNETFKSVLDEGGRCAQCSPGYPECNSELDIVTVNSIRSVHPTDIPKDCNHYGMSLNFTATLQQETNLTFYCYWLANKVEHGTFGHYQVLFQPSRSSHTPLIPLKLSVGSGGVVLLVLIVSLVCVVAIIKVKRRRSPVNVTEDTITIVTHEHEGGVNHCYGSCGGPSHGNEGSCRLQVSVHDRMSLPSVYEASLSPNENSDPHSI